MASRLRAMPGTFRAIFPGMVGADRTRFAPGRTFPFPVLAPRRCSCRFFENPAPGDGDGEGALVRNTARLTFKNWSRCGQLPDKG